MARKAGSAKQDEINAAEEVKTKKRGRPPKVQKDLSERDSTVSEEMFLASVKTFKKLTQEKDTSVANLRAHLKHCDGLGINLKAMKSALAAEKMAEELRFGYMRDTDQYLKFLRVPTGTQFGLFEQELPLDDDERQAKAYKEGKVAGASGKTSTDNPHHLNSLSGQEWHRGWLDSQKTIVSRMGPDEEGAGASQH